MARQVPEEELEAIVQAVASSESAVSIEDIAASLPGIPRRTLQRRVAALVEQGRLIQEGRARASRYRMPEHRGKVVYAEIFDGIALRDEAEAQLPFSDEGRAIPAIGSDHLNILSGRRTGNERWRSPPNRRLLEDSGTGHAKRLELSSLSPENHVWAPDTQC